MSSSWSSMTMANRAVHGSHVLPAVIVTMQQMSHQDAPDIDRHTTQCIMRLPKRCGPACSDAVDTRIHAIQWAMQKASGSSVLTLCMPKARTCVDGRLLVRRPHADAAPLRAVHHSEHLVLAVVQLATDMIIRRVEALEPLHSL